MNVFKMGLRSLLYRKRQYISLFLVCLFGVGVSLFCVYLIQGMLFALETKAKIYYGGDLMFIGGKNKLSFDNAKSFVEKLEPVFPEGTTVSSRFDFDADYAAFYFEGTGVRQRIIKGVDFAKEKNLFKAFNYVAGGVEDIAGTNGVLLSQPIAEILGVKTGDSITMMLITSRGYTNTVTLVVKGIFKDSSLFGMYTSYMDINHLLEAYGMPRDWANRICINVPDGSASEKDILMYQKSLESLFNMFHLVEDKQVFYDQLLSGKFSEPTYALIKLSANLEDLQILIDAMKGIAAFVIITLLVIIIVGVSSTYRIIAMKRINEIGIYMSIGMKRQDILFMLLLETLILLFFGCLGGLCFALLLCKLVGVFNLSIIPAFDIFLTDGVLVPIVSIGFFVLVAIAVCVTTLVAVLFAVRKSVSVMPSTALGVTE
ncbi:MAG: FtsX-like permease family protein [Spirochaetaceae bacterium]|nr:FtsX-like permease family protein [Spirochaetaceae bacterium]